MTWNFGQYLYLTHCYKHTVFTLAESVVLTLYYLEIGRMQVKVLDWGHGITALTEQSNSIASLGLNEHVNI